MEVATTKTAVDLVRLTVREMGFPRGATTIEIYARIRELGLLICPAEVGPALRQAYADQPIGEWIRVGMDPIAVSDGRLSVFLVDRGDGARWLNADWAEPTDQWSPGTPWVFLRSKQ